MSVWTLVRSSILGLFVDDWIFAALILVWLVLCWRLLPRLPVSPFVPPVILFSGLAIIMMGSVLARARSGR